MEAVFVAALVVTAVILYILTRKKPPKERSITLEVKLE